MEAQAGARELRRRRAAVARLYGLLQQASRFGLQRWFSHWNGGVVASLDQSPLLDQVFSTARREGGARLVASIARSWHRVRLARHFERWTAATGAGFVHKAVRQDKARVDLARPSLFRAGLASGRYPFN